MRRDKTLLLAFVLAVLVGMAGLLLLQQARSEGSALESHREFQTLVGGLGFGPVLDLSRCPNSFDPRFCRSCPQDREPIPGGAVFCPEHAGSIFYYPRLVP